MNKQSVALVCALVILLLLGNSPSLATAQDGEPEPGPRSIEQTAEDVHNYFPVQGRLTNAGGQPLDGDYMVTFRLYDVLTGGEALCSDTNLVHVVKGLFSSEVWGNCQDYIKGAQLYLGIEVESNGEMTPRQPIYAVPYAWSLRPGAILTGSVGPGAMLHVENTDPGGRGLRAYSLATTGENYGLVAADTSPNGFGGYIYNIHGGVGLKAESDTNAAIQAAGSGIIQSTANSYVWISGNGLRPYNHNDTTIIDLDSIGGAIIHRGSAAGNKNVMLPITLTGPLYGQNVRVTGLDVYYSGDTAFDAITVTLLRRQTGVCSAASCFVNVVNDGADLSCENGANPTGCSHHFNATSNNILSATSGILYLTFELAFNSDTSWFEIGGVRLTLEHD